MIKLNYNELLKRYDEILLSTSRGFDTEHEFLELWVPNDNINQSISELVAAANDCKIKEFELALSEEEFKKINIENLKEKISHIGTLELKKYNLVFFINKS